jgi:hypothetical protein
MDTVTRVGLDIANSVFQVHGINAAANRSYAANTEASAGRRIF